MKSKLESLYIPTTAAPDRGRPSLETNAQKRFVHPDLRKKVMDRDGHKCVRCGAIDYLEIDHAIPVALGGDGSNEKNLQVLCRKCNSLKKDRQWWGNTLREEGLRKCGSEESLRLLMKRTGLEDF